MSGDPLAYVYGALGGLGILLLFYGFGRVLDKTKPEAERKSGLWLINGGLLCIAASAALLMWAG